MRINGDFTGSLLTTKMGQNGTNAQRFQVLGDLDADATVINEIGDDNNVNPEFYVTGELVAAREVSVGTNVESNAAITFDGSVEGGVSIDGALSGVLTVNGDLDGPVTIGGDLAGTLIVAGSTTEAVSVDGFISGTIKVGGSLSGDIAITTLGGLTGQIILNAADSTGAWNSLVKVGDPPTPEIILGPSESGANKAPYYGVGSSQLGGGAVGLARFTFHETDSGPDDDAVISGVVTQADMQMYGPVKVVTGTGSLPPVKVERRHLSSSTWNDVSSAYTVSAITSPFRLVRIVPNIGTFQKGYEYRFTPVQDSAPTRLVCDITANPQPVPLDGRPVSGDDPDLYSFSIEPTMLMMDGSGDGKLDEADLAEWLADPFDLDDDGKATEEDYALLEYLVETKGE